MKTTEFQPGNSLTIKYINWKPDKKPAHSPCKSETITGDFLKIGFQKGAVYFNLKKAGKKFKIFLNDIIDIKIN